LVVYSGVAQSEIAALSGAAQGTSRTGNLSWTA
jgi:hypothetical protein